MSNEKKQSEMTEKILCTIRMSIKAFLSSHSNSFAQAADVVKLK